MLVVNLLFASHKRTVGFVFGTRVAAIAVNVPRAERHTDCLASLS